MHALILFAPLLLGGFQDIAPPKYVAAVSAPYVAHNAAGYVADSSADEKPVYQSGATSAKYKPIKTPAPKTVKSSQSHIHYVIWSYSVPHSKYIKNTSK